MEFCPFSRSFARCRTGRLQCYRPSTEVMSVGFANRLEFSKLSGFFRTCRRPCGKGGFVAGLELCLQRGAVALAECGIVDEVSVRSRAKPMLDRDVVDIEHAAMRWRIGADDLFHRPAQCV